MKKAPSFFRKKYTEKKLQTKIYKKIFIPADLRYVKSLFVKVGERGKKKIPVYSIPADKTFDKKEFARLKELAKSIKKQKGRLKFIPLAACLIFIAALAVFIALGKNALVKKGIQALCESIFNAKCDIDSVDLRILDSSLEVRSLAVADQNAPMTNLFSLDSIIVDFDLNQLLKAKFDAENLSALGLAFGTERTVSGALPEKKKKEQTEEESAFAAYLTEKASDAVSAVKSSLEGIFDQYNPQTIIESCYAQLKSPAVSEAAQSELERIIPAWQDKPAELEASFKTAQESAQTAAAIDLNAVKSDPAKIQSAITDITSAVNEVQNFKNEAEDVVDSIKSDASAVTKLAAEIQSAISGDLQIVSGEISKITSFSLDDGKRLLTGTLDTVVYSLLGNYYPYAQKAIAAAAEIKAASAASKTNDTDETETSKKTKKEKKTLERASGRTIYYRDDPVPAFLIQKIEATGTNFAAKITDVSSDMDRWGKPAVGYAAFTLNDLSHEINATVDARADTSAPLVSGDYDGAGFPFTLAASEYIDAAGVPDFAGTGALSFGLTADESGAFSISGGGSLYNMSVTAQPFEPEFASNLYAGVLAGITRLDADVSLRYNPSSGLTLNLSSDADTQFINALKKQMNAELSAIKESLQNELSEQISKLTEGSLGDIASFNEIYSKITDTRALADELANQLQSKLSEAQSMLTSQVQSAVTTAAEQATSAASSAVKNALKSLF